MTTQRVHLQHEVEILSQKSSSDSLALKDDLRGLLDDRKMAVRMEQQALDGRIQELNYKITVALNSDSKSEVEGLRWVLTRRAAMAIAGFACELELYCFSPLYHRHQLIKPKSSSSAPSAIPRTKLMNEIISANWPLPLPRPPTMVTTPPTTTIITQSHPEK